MSTEKTFSCLNDDLEFLLWFLLVWFFFCWFFRIFMNFLFCCRFLGNLKRRPAKWDETFSSFQSRTPIIFRLNRENYAKKTLKSFKIFCRRCPYALEFIVNLNKTEISLKKLFYWKFSKSLSKKKLIIMQECQ